jgi:HEAT repeat protein
VAAIPYLVLADTLESREAFRDRLIGIGCDADQRTMSWTRVDLSCPFDLSGASLDSAAGAGSGTGGNAAWVEKRAARGDKDAIRELPGLGSPQAFGILESVILTNPLEDVRQAAIVAMASLDDPRKIDVLGGILVAEKWTVAKTCAEALGRTRNALAAPYLIRAIELNVDWVTAQASAEALGLLPAAPAGMRALVMALNRGSFQGIAAKQSLVRFSLEAAPALRENLRRRLKGEALRLTLDALRLIGDRDALPPLRELESSVTDPADRLAVQEAIEALSEAPAGD